MAKRASTELGLTTEFDRQRMAENILETVVALGGGQNKLFFPNDIVEKRCLTLAELADLVSGDAPLCHEDVALLIGEGFYNSPNELAPSNS